MPPSEIKVSFQLFEIFRCCGDNIVDESVIEISVCLPSVEFGDRMLDRFRGTPSTTKSISKDLLAWRHDMNDRRSRKMRSDFPRSMRIQYDDRVHLQSVEDRLDHDLRDSVMMIVSLGDSDEFIQPETIHPCSRTDAYHRFRSTVFSSWSIGKRAQDHAGVEMVLKVFGDRGFPGALRTDQDNGMRVLHFNHLRRR